MTNFEKYKDEILGIIESNWASPAVVRGRPMACNEVASCGDCDFYNCENSPSCGARFVKWLYEDESDSEPEDPLEKTSSCENCRHNDKGTDEYPCVECKERYILKFEPKPKEPELKTCPFCGGDGRVVVDGWGNYTIQCNNCASFMGWFTSREKVIEVWNTRKGE